jgi:uncharacterized glyoxalase superfamily protein PhnB
MTTTSTTQTTVWPTLIYRDAPAALHFLAEAFGFEETLVVPGDAEGVVAHAEMRWPLGGGIMLGSLRSDSVLGEKHAGAASVCVVTDEPDALFARATAAGAKVVLGLEDTHYGSRGFTVEDAEGNLWTFGTYRGA